MDITLKSSAFVTTSPTYLLTFLAQIFDVENSMDQQGQFIEFGQVKMYIISSPQSVFPETIELEVDEELADLRERIEFFLYRSSDRTQLKIENFSDEDNYILLSDFERRNWIIRRKL